MPLLVLHGRRRPFGNQITFKLGERSQQREEQLAHRVLGVDTRPALINEVKSHTGMIPLLRFDQSV